MIDNPEPPHMICINMPQPPLPNNNNAMFTMACTWNCIRRTARKTSRESKNQNATKKELGTVGTNFKHHCTIAHWSYGASAVAAFTKANAQRIQSIPQIHGDTKTNVAQSCRRENSRKKMRRRTHLRCITGIVMQVDFEPLKRCSLDKNIKLAMQLFLFWHKHRHTHVAILKVPY